MLTIRIAVAIVARVQMAITYYVWILYSRVLPIIVKHANLTRSAAKRTRTITGKIRELGDYIKKFEGVARGTGVSKSRVAATFEEQGVDKNLAKAARSVPKQDTERRSYAVERQAVRIWSAERSHVSRQCGGCRVRPTRQLSL
jgi:hypothetical protein